MFETQKERILQSLDVAHATYYQAGTFTGPSLYFHLRALEAGKGGDSGRFADSVYALLAAWGMHRMGRGGSKMREFEDFQASLEVEKRKWKRGRSSIDRLTLLDQQFGESPSILIFIDGWREEKNKD